MFEGGFMNRRSFLKTVGFTAPLLAFLGNIPKMLWAGKLEHSKKDFWKDKKFIQNSVDLSGYKNGMIKAKIDDTWKEFNIRKASDEFIKWNLEKRLKFLEDIKKGVMGWGGPHQGAVATYGLGRLDSKFTVNNAIKGMGLAPKDENLDKAIKRLKDTFESPMPEKMDILKSLYEKDADFFDWRKQTSLELYSTPTFETHTFLNVMDNPVATIVYLDIPSFEIRTIARVVHPEDKSALPSEKKLLEFVNLAHEYMHGKFSRIFPLLLFYIIEEFDNTPGSKLGIRTVPKRPKE
jgi:hypothetical protein